MSTQSGFFISPNADFDYPQPSLERLDFQGSSLMEFYRSRSGGRSRLFKVLREEYRGNPLYESILRKEFEIGYSLAHPGICEVYSFRNLDKLGNAIEMEWVDGMDLAKAVRSGLVPKKNSGRILCQICDALDYMHGKQVIHRDLKPENILITMNGAFVKIIDFGFSDSGTHDIGKTPAGTRHWASPELIEGKTVGPTSDLYSLGMIMKELFPGQYSQIADKCTMADSGSRYFSARELKEAIISSDKKRTRIREITLALILAISVAAVIILSSHHSESEVDRIFHEAESLFEQHLGINPSSQE